MKFEVTIIGSGDTLGTPVAGEIHPTCLDPKSKRFRFGLLIAIDETKILIDTNPDLKWQCLDNSFELKEIDYILITHSHSDHLNGMGEFFYRRQIPTKVYYQDNPLTEKHIEYFRYLEREEVLTFESCKPFEEFQLNKNIKILPIQLNHGFPAIGYIITAYDKKVAIVTDSNSNLSEETLIKLEGVDALFIDSFSEDIKQAKEVYKTCNIPVPENFKEEWFHMTFEESKKIAEVVKAVQTYPIHISRYVSLHEELVKKHSSEKFIVPYDGMIVKI